MTEPAIALQDVSVSLGDRRVLEAVNLDIAEGDYMAIIGPNGGGKTTLLRVILGIIPPEAGSVRVLGHTPKQARGRVGYVPQFVRFDLEFPVRVVDVVRMGWLGRRPITVGRRRAERQRALGALEQLGMADVANRPVGALSGGQLQRVLIARALAFEPELLLLDEPTASLDVGGASAFYELVGELAKRMTVILVSHDIGGVIASVRSIACVNRQVVAGDSGTMDAATIEKAYGCPVDLMAHGARHTTVCGWESDHD